MIDIEKTISLRGYDPLTLKPQSCKVVWANCNNCGKGRWVGYYQYRDLCTKCSHNTSESLKRNRERAIKQWSDQKERDAQSIRRLQYFIDNPEAGKLHSIRLIQWCKNNPESLARSAAIRQEYWSDQNNRDTMSEIMKNSEACKSAQDEMRGGNDIVKHHYIYDHANPEKYTMKVTRAKHVQIHWWMRKAGIVVPHINVTENKEIFNRKNNRRNNGRRILG